MGPRAAEIQVEGVAAFFGGELGVGRGGDGGAELGGFAAELAIWVGVFVDGGLRKGGLGGFLEGRRKGADFLGHGDCGSGLTGRMDSKGNPVSVFEQIVCTGCSA